MRNWIWIPVLGLAAVLSMPKARAFCGFFVAGSNAKLTNSASQVVLVRQGRQTVMTLSNTYQGPLEDFAMVVPVPVVLKEKDVKTLAPDVFDHVDALSAPRLVEYWEQDPCRPRYEENADSVKSAPPMAAPMRSRKSAEKDLGVTVEARFTVGEYQILILSAKESNGLETWLKQNKYTIPKGAAAALAPYVRDQMKFFVAKVDIKKVKRTADGTVALSPLRFGFESSELRLPVRLGLLNAGAKQDLIVYVLSPSSRYEVANYPNVFIPTNVEVTDGVRSQFASFYAELFDATLAQRQGKAVVTEYAWQTTSCDPCPTPPLTPSDLVTLGVGPQHGGDAGGSAPSPRRSRGPVWGGFSSWVLTRLHARYDKASLSEDLIFREAKPVMGGRASWDGTAADAGAQVVASGTNNFQGRYIIRHYWTGAVSCSNPRYGQWGGPPGGMNEDGRPRAARNLASAPRGKVALKGAVRSPVPLLGIPGQPPPRRKPARSTPAR